MNIFLFYGNLLRQLQEKNDLCIDLACQIREEEPGEGRKAMIQLISILHSEIKDICNQLLEITIPQLESSKREIIQCTLLENCRLNLLFNLFLREGKT